MLDERRSEIEPTSGRSVGALVLAHLIAAMFVPFLMVDIVRGEKGAVAGLLACMMQIASVSLRVFCGYPPIMELAMPLAPIHLTLAVWLMVKGFREHPV